METLHFTPDEEIPTSQAYAGKAMLTMFFNTEGCPLVDFK
jgi:hypothetical protein